VNDKSATGSTDIYADISLTAVFRVVRKYWYLVIGSLVISVAISLAIAFLSTPLYQSSSLISSASGTTSASGNISRLLQSFGGGGFFGGGGGASTRNARAVGLAALSSPYFTRAFIEEHGLLPILFADLWDAENQKWLVDDPADIPTLSDGYDVFADNLLTVSEEDLSGLVMVAIEWKDPILASEWTNKLIEGVNERLRQQAINDADLTIKYLNEELGSTQAVQLQQAIYFLIEAEIQKRTVAKVQKEYSFKVVSPATPSDPDKHVWPKKIFVISVGIALGLFVGLVLAFIASPVVGAVRDAKRQAPR
jgi:capsular polysaccharide biosynthesis protein